VELHGIGQAGGGADIRAGWSGATHAQPKAKRT
jgi:hypothetical protein